MRIGFLGNANNYPFMLARALQRAGHEVVFIVDRIELLNRPENRYADIRRPYPPWLVDMAPVDLCALPRQPRRQQIIQLLNSCDLVLLNQYGVQLGVHLTRPYVALLTGTDVEELTQQSWADQQIGGGRWLRRVIYRAYLRSLAAAQSEGIRNAWAVSFFWPGTINTADEKLAQIGVASAQRFFLLMTDTDLIRPLPLVPKPLRRFFCVARLTWRRPERIISDLDYKGTDVMLRGFALARKMSSRPFQLVLVEKGDDVAEAHRLVDNLGLSDVVEWRQLMTQTEVLEQYRLADAVLDQFGVGMIGMGALDAMAMARPVIANARPEVLEPIIGEPSPVLQARTPEEVARQVCSIVENPGAAERIGADSAAYVSRHFSADRGAEVLLGRFLGNLPTTTGKSSRS